MTRRQLPLRIIPAWIGLLLVSAQFAVSAEYHVPKDGSLGKVLANAGEGSVITVAPGTYVLKEGLTIKKKKTILRGEPGVELRVESDFSGGRLIGVEATDCVIENLVLDGSLADARAITAREKSTRLRITRCELRNWRNHIIDIDGDDCLIEECQIHHALRNENGTRVDAHGVVTLESKRLLIRRCQIWNCSGDSVQTGRGHWTDVTIDDCEMFQEPLIADMAGFPKGALVGENAYDSKRPSKAPPGKITISNCRLWGFKTTYEEGNWAALNLKEHITGEIKNCKIRDSQIGIRMALNRKGGRVSCHVVGCEISDCDFGFRIEDQKFSDDDQRPGSTIDSCLIKDCKIALRIVGMNNRSNFTDSGLQKGDSIINCKFSPSMSVLMGTGDAAFVSKIRKLLFAAGNSEDKTPPATSTSKPKSKPKKK